MRFLIGLLSRPGRFKVYVSCYLIENFTVRCLFYLRADIGKQIKAFFTTNNYNSLIYSNFAVPVFRCCAVHSLRNVRYGLILKGLSLEESRTLLYLDTSFSEDMIERVNKSSSSGIPGTSFGDKAKFLNGK